MRLCCPATACLLLLSWSAAAPGQDFDPSGRRHRPAAGHAGGHHRPHPAHRPSGKPDVAKLIRRYTAIVLSRPDESFPLDKLAQLYRQRDGSLDKLIAELERRAASGAERFDARIALAGIYQRASRPDDARRLLAAAVHDQPKRAAPRLMLARLSASAGDKSAARDHYRAALPLLAKAVDRERVLRALMLLSLDLHDFDAARAFHHDLVKRSGGSLYVDKELGQELLQRSHFARAESEFRRIVRAAAGDNRALAPALRDLGKALAKQKKLGEALKVLARARRIAGQQAGIRAEILTLLTEIFRGQGKLTELIAVLKAEPGHDFQRTATIGALYEETGQVELAIASYRAALRLHRADVDVRVKLVHLLQTAGLLDDAIKEYRALIRAAPHNADFVFELAETLISRGDRDEALELVAGLEHRTAREGDVLAAIADFYERIEEQGRAVKLLERLAKLPASDPQHLIDLGDRYFQQGKVKLAERTWQRIRGVVKNRARASAVLGEVYLEHDLPNKALAAFREAVKLAPTSTRYRKQLAIALERTASALRRGRYRYREALGIWEKLLGQAGNDPLLARECRTHVVSLWSILRQLRDHLRPLQLRLTATPPDLQAGRLLAEVQRRLHRLTDAEKTLRLVVRHAPGDETALLALERILVMQRDLVGAIAVLEKLVRVNPKRARQFYQRMAQYAAELYRDDDAIAYAARAVALSPNDAVGHYRLAKMYRRRQDTRRAMQELREAISKNDRLFRAYFDLAEMLLTGGKADDADQLYRRIVRSARDEDMVSRAARLSMQINLGRGGLQSLERVLLPVALGNPNKPIYRRLLVELYGAMTFPLVHRARFGRPRAAQQARQQLAAIGMRAVKPLLDALTDERVSQQRIAIETLAYVQNKGAGPALFNFALGHAEQTLRVRAMIACGALADPALLDRYKELLATDRRGGVLAAGGAIAVAATWGVARMHSAKAEPLLSRLLRAGSPDVRALAALGLGLTHDKRHAEALAALARSPEAGPIARAAAAYALGELADSAQIPLLLALSESPEPELKRTAVLSLARSLTRAHAKATPGPDVQALLARTLISTDSTLRETAVAATTALATGTYRSATNSLPVPNGVVSVQALLHGLAPTGYRPAERARALIGLQEPLAAAARRAASTSPEQARVVADLVLAALAPLVGTPSSGVLPQKLTGSLHATVDRLAHETVPAFAALTDHPSADIRKRAVELLARRPEPQARAALTKALDGGDPEVCKTALGALDADHDAATVRAAMRLLAHHPSWAVRVRAAAALSTAGRHHDQSDARLAREVRLALARAAEHDSFALVREAALQSLARRFGALAHATLERIRKRDAEPRVRHRAAMLLHPAPGGSSP